MTRAQIVAEAARRLGDESTAFLAEVDAAFDFVLQDLAAEEVIGHLRKLGDDAVTVEDQRNYHTRDLSGVSSPDWPDRILSLRVWAWGVESLIRGPVTDTEFEERRACEGEDLRGRPRIWRYYPNQRQVQVHPPCDADAAGETIECLYLAPPTEIISEAELGEIHRADVETIVFGLQARNAQFLDETMSDAATAWQLYIAGRDRMRARRFNRGVGQIEPDL